MVVISWQQYVKIYLQYLLSRMVQALRNFKVSTLTKNLLKTHLQNYSQAILWERNPDFNVKKYVLYMYLYLIKCKNGWKQRKEEKNKKKNNVTYILYFLLKYNKYSLNICQLLAFISQFLIFEEVFFFLLEFWIQYLVRGFQDFSGNNSPSLYPNYRNE